MKINKQIISCAWGILLLGMLSLKVQADDSSSEMMSQLGQLKGMIADKDKFQDSANTDWGQRNPFNTFGLIKAPEVKVSTKGQEYILEGIINGNKPSAIINKMVVGIGDTIEGATVQIINNDSVELLDAQDNKIVLSLKR